MKIKDMDAHQKEAYKIMDEMTIEYIGGQENTMQDYSENTEEYKDAKAFLEQGHDNLKEFFYHIIVREADLRGYAKHIRFAGKDFIMERIEVRLKKWGY